MPIKTIPNSNIPYYLISYNKQGNERHDDPDVSNGILSQEVIRQAQSGNYTDIFFSSHGWKGDIPAAIDQYNRWMGAMLQCKEDIARLKARSQGFKPLIIGLHWPSLPYGEEEYTHSSSAENSDNNELDTGSLDFGLSEDATSKYESYEYAVDSISDSDNAKKALKTILNSPEAETSSDELPEELEAAFNTLIAEFTIGDASNAPGEDNPAIDAKSLYEVVKQEYSDEGDDLLSFGIISSTVNLVKKTLTQLSIWDMKKRARTFGESGGARLLRELLSVTSSSVGFHLMGHSLGCVVISSTILGKGAKEPLPRPVNSVFLVQGAVSLWAYCRDISIQPGTAGYYQSLSSPEFVSGPILVSHTFNDNAVTRIYPVAATLGMGIDFGIDESFDELPKYGGLGTHGARGDGISIQYFEILPENGQYNFKSGQFNNIDTSKYMKEDGFFSGAHNDIDHPEVAHIFWSGIALV